MVAFVTMMIIKTKLFSEKTMWDFYPLLILKNNYSKKRESVQHGFNGV